MFTTFLIIGREQNINKFFFPSLLGKEIELLVIYFRSRWTLYEMRGYSIWINHLAKTLGSRQSFLLWRMGII